MCSSNEGEGMAGSESAICDYGWQQEGCRDADDLCEMAVLRIAGFHFVCRSAL